MKIIDLRPKRDERIFSDFEGNILEKVNVYAVDHSNKIIIPIANSP